MGQKPCNQICQSQSSGIIRTQVAYVKLNRDLKFVQYIQKLQTNYKGYKLVTAFQGCKNPIFFVQTYKKVTLFAQKGRFDKAFNPLFRNIPPF